MEGVRGRSAEVGRGGWIRESICPVDLSRPSAALQPSPRRGPRAAADAAAAPAAAAAAAAGPAALLARARGAPASPQGWDPGPTDRRPCPPGGGGSGLAESLPSQEGTLWGF